MDLTAIASSSERPGIPLMKLFLLQLGHSHSENSLHVFDTAEERDAKTCEVIFGEKLADLDPNDSRSWGLYRQELNDSGSVEFEGDPGLQWFTAHDEREPRTAEQRFADKDRFVGYVADAVNPARLKEGLAVISMTAAGVCYDVLTERRYQQPRK